MQHNVTLDIIAECIRRDPPSWKGISLLYARPAYGTPSPALGAIVEQATRSKPSALSFTGKNSGAVMLGLDRPPDMLPETASYFCWINDIANQWPLASSALAAVLEEHNPSPSSGTGYHAALPEKVSILVVEDDPMTSQMVALHLERFGTVIRTANAREAVANYMVRRPDIIFLDIHYQDDKGDGFDVLRSLLSTDSNAFVVMVSGDRTPATVLKALRLGAEGFIAKPFQASDFTGYLIKFNQRMSTYGNPAP